MKTPKQKTNLLFPPAPVIITKNPTSTPITPANKAKRCLSQLII